MFTTNFDSFVTDEETITCVVDGFDCTATIYADDDSTPPWERGDGHGPVSDWTSRDKRPGEKVLNTDGQSKRYYDYAEAIKIAKRDGWDAEPFGTGTKGERAKRAVDADFEAMRAWCNDEWHYVGVAVTVSRNGIKLTGRYEHAVWGVDANYPGSDNSYLRELANEELSGALEDARAVLAKLCAA